MGLRCLLSRRLRVALEGIGRLTLLLDIAQTCSVLLCMPAGGQLTDGVGLGGEGGHVLCMRIPQTGAS